MNNIDPVRMCVSFDDTIGVERVRLHASSRGWQCTHVTASSVIFEQGGVATELANQMLRIRGCVSP